MAAFRRRARIGSGTLRRAAAFLADAKLGLFAVADGKISGGPVSGSVGRKLLVVIGYGLAAATKPAFALASSVSWVFAARFVDRVGKGMRGVYEDGRS